MEIQRIWLGLFLIFSLCFLSGCPPKNKLTVCVSHPEKDGFVCSHGGDNNYDLPYKESAKYIAMPPDDAQTLLEKCQAWKDE